MSNVITISQGSASQTCGLGDLPVLESDIIDVVRSSLKACWLSYQLQSTLDLKELFRIFSDEVRSQCPVDAVRFEPNGPESGICFGASATDIRSRSGIRIDYPVRISSTYLGQVSFRCERMLMPDEVERLEKLLTALMYPLRNTLLFQRARETADIFKSREAIA